MDSTPNLALPYIMAAQAQKHVTHNEAIRALDALVQIGVVDRDLTAPPVSPANGDRYIVATGASGAWAGKDGQLAAWLDGAWAYYPPQEGWLAWVADEDSLVAWDGSSWVTAGGGGLLNPAPLVGVNATADSTNRLAVKSDAVLLSHDDVTPGTGDQRTVLNKAADSNTASVLFQTGYSGRAEFGTTGDDDFHVKVSPDGSTWHEALSIEQSTGRSVFHAIAQWLGDLLTGNVIWRYVPPTSDPTAPNFSMSMQNAAWSNGPPGEENYYDHVAHMGWNWVGGTREDTDQAGFGLSFESKFYGGGTFGHEFHLQGQDTAGNPHRWLSFFLPTDGGTGSGCTFQIDRVTFQALDGSDRLQFNFAASSKTIAISNGVAFFVNDNNTPVFKQHNAAESAFLSLPYIDASDRCLVGAPLYVVPGTADSGFGSCIAVHLQNPTADNRLIHLQHAGTLTGSLEVLHAHFACTANVRTEIANNATDGDVIDYRRVFPGDGDALTCYRVNGAGEWSIGIDNSDDDSFKISAANQALGSNDRLRIDANRAEWFLPVKLPSYTVAGLPSAANAGAGALAYVTDASGGPTLACSDGTNWRVASALGATVS